MIVTGTKGFEGVGLRVQFNRAGSPVSPASMSNSSSGSAPDFAGGSAFDLLASEGGDDEWEVIPVKPTRKVETVEEVPLPHFSAVPGSHQGLR